MALTNIENLFKFSHFPFPFRPNWSQLALAPTLSFPSYKTQWNVCAEGTSLCSDSEETSIYKPCFPKASAHTPPWPSSRLDGAKTTMVWPHKTYLEEPRWKQDLGCKWPGGNIAPWRYFIIKSQNKNGRNEVTQRSVWALLECSVFYGHFMWSGLTVASLLVNPAFTVSTNCFLCVASLPKCLDWPHLPGIRRIIKIAWI